jgi:hypothetical protein
MACDTYVWRKVLKSTDFLVDPEAERNVCGQPPAGMRQQTVVGGDGLRRALCANHETQLPAHALYSFALSASVTSTFRSGTRPLSPSSSSMPVVSGNVI